MANFLRHRRAWRFKGFLFQFDDGEIIIWNRERRRNKDRAEFYSYAWGFTCRENGQRRVYIEQRAWDSKPTFEEKLAKTEELEVEGESPIYPGPYSRGESYDDHKEEIVERETWEHEQVKEREEDWMEGRNQWPTQRGAK